jgi:biopolymer transport protein ExbD
MKLPVNAHRPKRITLSMTAMIDVVFLLLIFFICTANFSPPEERLPMNLSHPGALSEVVQLTKEEEDFKFASLRVVAEDGPVYWQINDRTCQSLEEVGAVLRELARIKPDLPILIEMDDAAAWEHFIHVYDLCRASGLSRPQLVGE